MRILFVLANCTFPPQEGAHDQTIRVIRSLSEAGCCCDVVVSSRGIGSFSLAALERAAPGVRVLLSVSKRGSYTLFIVLNIVARFLWSLRFLRSFLLGRVGVRLSDAILIHEALRRCEDYDVVHFEGVQLAPLASILGTVPLVFSSVDAWSLRQRRLMRSAGKFWRRTLRRFAYGVAVMAEQSFLKSLPHVHVVSPADASYLQSVGVKGAISVPVALPSELVVMGEDTADRARGGVLVLGDIRVPYIRDGIARFLEKLLPDLEDLGLAVTVTVLSRVSPSGVLAELQTKWPDRLAFVEWVDDFGSVLRSAQVIVLPDLNGTGQKNRTVAALASGSLVLGTPAAFEGIGTVDGHHAVMRSSPGELAKEALHFVQNEAACNEIGARGKEFAVSLFAPAHVVTMWKNLYSRAIRDFGRGGTELP